MEISCRGILGSSLMSSRIARGSVTPPPPAPHYACDDILGACPRRWRLLLLYLAIGYMWVCMSHTHICTYTHTQSHAGAHTAPPHPQKPQQRRCCAWSQGRLGRSAGRPRLRRAPWPRAAWPASPSWTVRRGASPPTPCADRRTLTWGGKLVRRRDP